MDVTEKAIISLIKSALYGEKTVLPEDFDWERAKSIINSQEIYGLICFGLYNSGIEKPNWLELAFYSRYKIMTTLWYYGEEITENFKKNGIEFLPLKGVVLKDLYPDPYMRHMSDIDILIRERDYAEKVKPLMLNLGYTEGSESDHEYHWTKNKFMIELHKRIIPSYNEDFYKVTGDGWDWVQNHGYAYIFTHFAKHYRDRGIGIGHFIDLEILSSQATDDGLKELRLDKFHDNVKRTLDCWFRGKEFDEVTEHITEVIFKSGEYGREETGLKACNLKKINAAKGNAKKARFKDFMSKVFPPYSAMAARFKVLKPLPFLLPVTWGWRIIVSPFRGNIRKNYISNKMITDDVSDYKKELNLVGLDYWF